MRIEKRVVFQLPDSGQCGFFYPRLVKVSQGDNCLSLKGTPSRPGKGPGVRFLTLFIEILPIFLYNISMEKNNP
jgi:hypothetical protein